MDANITTDLKITSDGFKLNAKYVTKSGSAMYMWQWGITSLLLQRRECYSSEITTLGD
jgi:hypothetical protein